MHTLQVIQLDILDNVQLHILDQVFAPPQRLDSTEIITINKSSLKTYGFSHGLRPGACPLRVRDQVSFRGG